MFKTATISRWGGARPYSGPRPRLVVPREDVARDDPPRWYCLRTDWGGELTASIELCLLGFEVFAPSIYRPPRPARRDGRIVRPARPAGIVPLFPRYLFVRFRRADRWQDIRAVPGVEAILGVSPDSPTPVADAAIEMVRACGAPNGCRYPANANLHDLGAAAPIVAGAEARILAGPMQDLAGLCEWSSAARVRLLMHLLGREVRVTLPRSAVEAA